MDIFIFQTSGRSSQTRIKGIAKFFQKFVRDRIQEIELKPSRSNNKNTGSKIGKKRRIFIERSIDRWIVNAISFGSTFATLILALYFLFFNNKIRPEFIFQFRIL